MNVSQYKCAIIQYACEDCLIGNNYTIKFNFEKGQEFQIKKGVCHHFKINFNSSINHDKCFFLFVTFQCKNCEHEQNEKVIDDSNKEEMKTLNYKCKKCGRGDLCIGVLFDKVDFNLNNSNNESQNLENGNNQINENQRIIGN